VHYLLNKLHNRYSTLGVMSHVQELRS